MIQAPAVAAVHAAADAIETNARIVRSLAESAQALDAIAKALRLLAESAATPSGAFTLTRTAQELGVSRGYVRKLIKDGQLVAERHEGDMYRVPRRSLEAYRRRSATA